MKEIPNFSAADLGGSEIDCLEHKSKFIILKSLVERGGRILAFVELTL